MGRTGRRIHIFHRELKYSLCGKWLYDEKGYWYSNGKNSDWVLSQTCIECKRLEKP